MASTSMSPAGHATMEATTAVVDASTRREATMEAPAGVAAVEAVSVFTEPAAMPPSSIAPTAVVIASPAKAKSQAPAVGIAPTVERITPVPGIGTAPAVVGISPTVIGVGLGPTVRSGVTTSVIPALAAMVGLPAR